MKAFCVQCLSQFLLYLEAGWSRELSVLESSISLRCFYFLFFSADFMLKQIMELCKAVIYKKFMKNLMLYRACFDILKRIEAELALTNC